MDRKLVLALLPALGACSSVSSDSVLTSGMYAQFAAECSGSKTRATAVLRVGGSTSATFVYLGEGDRLTVTAAGETQEMSETHLGDIYAYIADFDVVEEGTDFLFSLEREVDEGAPESTATLPAPFEFTAPEAGTTFSRSTEDITVSWDNTADDTIIVTFSGDCFYSYSEELSADTGSYTLPAGSLQPYSQHEDETCSAQLTVVRRRPGSLDPGFGEGGEVFAQQTRSLSFSSAP